MYILYYLFVPVSAIIAFFLKDANQKRKKVINILLKINLAIYFAPLSLVLLDKAFDGNMFGGNTGNGIGILLSYMIIIPLCILIQLVLLTLKVIYAVKSSSHNEP